MITVTVTGIPELRKKLKALEKSLNVTDILDESEAILLNRIRARFLAEQNPNNLQWKRSQAAIKENRKTLFKTGTLFHSIQAYKIGRNTRSIGTDVFYAKYHQFGTPTLPIRAFLGMNEDDLMIIERRVLQRITEALA